MNKRRLLNVLSAFLFCCFGFSTVAFGGLTELQEYEILIHGKLKRVLFVGLVHKSDQKKDRFVLSKKNDSTYRRDDHPASYDVFRDVIDRSNRIERDRDEECGEEEFVEQREIPVLLEVLLQNCQDQEQLNFFEYKVARGLGFACGQGGPGEPCDSEKLYLDHFPMKKIGNYTIVCAEGRDRETQKLLAVFEGDKIDDFSIKAHFDAYYEKYCNVVRDFHASVRQLGKGELCSVQIGEFDHSVELLSNRVPEGKTLIQWSYFLMMTGCLMEFALLKECGSFEKAQEIIPQGRMSDFKRTARAGIECILGDMSFFSTCVASLCQPHIETVVMPIGNYHARSLGRMLTECGARLVRKVGPFVPQKSPIRVVELGEHDAVEDDATYLLLKPFHLRHFLHQALLRETNTVENMASRYCNWCGVPAADLTKKLLVCSRCHKAYYCSQGCQRRDWKSYHKTECHKAEAEEEEEGEGMSKRGGHGGGRSRRRR